MINRSQQSYELSSSSQKRNQNCLMHIECMMQEHSFLYSKSYQHQQNCNFQNIQMPQNIETFVRRDFFNDQQPKFEKSQFEQQQQSLNISQPYGKSQSGSKNNALFQQSEQQEDADYRNQSKYIITPGTQLKEQEKLSSQLRPVDNDQILDLVLRNDLDSICQNEQFGFDSDRQQHFNDKQRNQTQILQIKIRVKKDKAIHNNLNAQIFGNRPIQPRKGRKCQKNRIDKFSQQQYLPYADNRTWKKRNNTSQKLRDVNNKKQQKKIGIFFNYQQQSKNQYLLLNSMQTIRETQKPSIHFKRQKECQGNDVFFKQKLEEKDDRIEDRLNCFQNVGQKSVKAQQNLSRYQNRELKKYFKETRSEKINRYLEKKKRRVWHKKVSYHCRKQLAETRSRVNGRFAKKNILKNVQHVSTKQFQQQK